jgi:hypothetical protein
VGVTDAKIVGLTVSAIIDRIAFEACFQQLADDLREIEAAIMRGLEAEFGNGSAFRVHMQVLS